MSCTKSARDKWSRRYEEVIQRFMVESLMSKESAEYWADACANLDDAIQPAFDHWIETGSVEKAPEVCGYTIQRLLDERHAVGVPCAFYWLQFLLLRPDEALAKLPQPVGESPLPHFVGVYHH